MYYSTKTTNKSFISMWRYLQRNNIDNNLFMLQTIDKDLMDFSIEKYMNMNREDPYFIEYKYKVIEEAKNNIWFYFRELVMIPDEDSISGYKHFELNHNNMKMIYLYDNKKSFFNIDTDNSLTLHFLWNLHKSKYNADLVIANDLDIVEKISDDIKKHIANMVCQVPIGSTQVLSDGINHSIIANKESFESFYLRSENNSLIKMINNTIDKELATNKFSEDKYAIFILENDMYFLTYSYLLTFIYDRNIRAYLNGIENKNTTEAIFLYNVAKQYIPLADTSIFDKTEYELEKIYLI